MPDLQPSRSPCCIRLETSPEKDAAEAEGTIKRTRHIASGGCCRCTSFFDERVRRVAINALLQGAHYVKFLELCIVWCSGLWVGHI